MVLSSSNTSILAFDLANLVGNSKKACTRKVFPAAERFQLLFYAPQPISRMAADFRYRVFRHEHCCWSRNKNVPGTPPIQNREFRVDRGFYQKRSRLRRGIWRRAPIGATFPRCQNCGVLTTAGQVPTKPVYGRNGVWHDECALFSLMNGFLPKQRRGRGTVETHAALHQGQYFSRRVSGAA
jgi:hypothetical protein